MGPLSYIQLTLTSILFPNFYTILSTQIQSCVRVSFYTVRPRESLGTCVQNSSVNFRGFLAQNSWITLSRVLVRMKKREPRKLPCPHSRAHVRLDPSHATNWSFQCCCRHWHRPNNFDNSSDAKNSRIDCDGACMVMMLDIAIYNTRPQSHTSYDNHITKLHLAWTLS